MACYWPHDGLRMLLNVCLILEYEARGPLVGACALADLSVIRKDQDQKTGTTKHHMCQCAGDENSRELSRGAGNVHQDTGGEVVEEGCDSGSTRV